MATVAPQRQPARPGLLGRCVVAPIRGLAGDDIFVSYSRADGISYAEGLAGELTRCGFACRLDLWETEPGKELPRALKRRIQWSKLLVIIGTEAAAASHNVYLEIETFLRTRSMIVPVAFGPRLDHAHWFSLIEGLPVTVESNPRALADGKPSESVVRRIENAARFRRRNRRLRNMAVFSMLTFLFLAAVSVVFEERARRAGLDALEAGTQAEVARKDAAAQTAKAREAEGRAAEAARNESAARGEAQAQQKVAAQAREGTQLEVAGNAVLRQFETGAGELDALRASIALGEQLRRFPPPTGGAARWLVLSPLAALNHTLQHIREKTRLNTHQSRLRGVAVSASGLIAVLEGDPYVNGGTVARLWTGGGLERNSWPLPRGGVNQVDFSPDGNELITAGGDKVQTWSLDGTLTHEWQGGFHFEQSSDGRVLVVLKNDQTALLVERRTGQTVELRPGNTGISRLRIHPSGTALLSSGNDHSLRVWDLSGHQKTFFEASQGYPSDFAYTSDGKWLVAVFSDGATYTLVAETGQQQYRWDSQAGRAGLRLSPKAAIAGTVGRDGVARLWNIDGTLRAQFIGHRGGVQGLDFSPDGEQLITTGNDGTVELWSASGAAITTLRGHQGRVTAAYFKPGMQGMVTAGVDDSVRIWDLRDHFDRLFGSSHPVLDIAPRRQGSGFVTVQEDAVRTWDAAGRLKREWALSGADPISHGFARISANQQLFVLSLRDGLTLFTMDGRKIRRLSSPWDGRLVQSDTRVLQAVFDPSGSHLAVLRAGGGLEIHDLQAGTRLDVRHSASGWVYGASFDRTGRHLATGWADGRIRVFSSGGSLEHDFDSGQRQTLDVAFSPDGATVAAAGADTSVRVFRPNGRLVRVLYGCSDRVLGVRFSVSGDLIAATSADGTVHVWDSDARTVAELAGAGGPRSLELQGGDFGSNPFAFSGDENTLAVTGRDGVVRLWPAANLTELLKRGRAWLRR